jgi:hypothetical protein
MSSSADFNLNALKDTYDYSCFLARLDEYRHSMTYAPGARYVITLEPRPSRPALEPLAACAALCQID